MKPHRTTFSGNESFRFIVKNISTSYIFYFFFNDKSYFTYAIHLTVTTKNQRKNPCRKGLGASRGECGSNRRELNCFCNVVLN